MRCGSSLFNSIAMPFLYDKLPIFVESYKDKYFQLHICGSCTVKMRIDIVELKEIIIRIIIFSASKQLSVPRITFIGRKVILAPHIILRMAIFG